jgi:hypothetical protein
MNGLVDEGLEIVRATRDRYDGSRRNPWSDLECGSYYARSMSSWQLVNAYSGQQADLVRGRLSFSPKADGDYSLPWSAGEAFGTIDRSGSQLTLRVVGGRLAASEVVLDGRSHALNGPLEAGQSAVLQAP